MDIKQLSPEFAATGQLDPADMPQIAEAGFKSIICNRPDDEGEGQPSFAEVAKAAAAAGIEARHLPVTPGDVTEAHGAAMAEMLGALPGPVLGYCKSGGRASMLWKMTQEQ